MDINQILADYVATANNPKYKGDYTVINSKFPELKDYDNQILADYVATANNKKYNNDFNIINSKFPEFFTQKKNPIQNGSLNISQPLPNGLKPAQTLVDTKPTQYVKPKVKPKNISEAVEDDNNYLGAMYNSLIGSGSDFIGGLTRLAAKSQPYTSPILAATADILGGKAEQVVEKLRSSSSSKQYEEKIQQGFDLTKGVFTKENAKAIPLMISRFAGDLGLAIPTAGASYIAQNYNQGLKEFDKAVGDRSVDDPVGLNNTRELFAIAYSTISSVADKYSLGFITKNNPVAKKVKESILKETVKELATKTTGKITADVIEETASRIAKKGLNKFKSVGLKGLTSAGVEGGTEVITGTGTDIAKLATNILTEKEIFNSEEVAEDFWKNRLNEFGGGAVLGGAAGSAIRGIKSVDDMVAERVSSATSLNNLREVAQELNQELAARNDEGSLDNDRYDEIVNKLNNYVKATESIPFDIGAKKRKEAIKSIVERDRVSEEIKAKQEQINASDESLMPQGLQELDILEAKKQSLNDNVVESASDEKFTYSKDPEKDKWYKKLGEDGELEEISKQQYELETQSVPQPAKPKIETREDIIKEIRAAESEMERTGDFADYKIKIDDLNARLENLVPEPEIEGESAQPTQEDVLITPETVSKPKIVVHATEGDSGFALSQFEGVDKNNIVKPEDVRAFVSDGKTKVIGEAKVDESGGTEISIAAPMEDVGGRPGGARYDITIPNGSTAKAQEIVDIIQAEHIKSRDKGDKQLIPRVTKLIKDYIDSRTPTEIINTKQQPKPKTDAVQVETAGQVPVLTEAKAGQEVEQGKPKSKAKGVTEEGGKEEVAPTKPIDELKQDVKKAKGKTGKTSALQTLKENSTPEDFKAFMDDNPVYQKYETKAEPVVEQEITDTTEIELPAEKKSVSKDRLAELEKQKNELLKKIRKAGANLSSGFNPEVIGDLVKLGAIYVEEGIITFKDFAAQLKKDYGKDIPEDIARDVFRKSAAVSGLGIRRTPERIGTGEGVSPILKEVANETAALYQKQDYKKIQEKLDEMSEEDKIILVGKLSNFTNQFNAEDNIGVLAAIDLINMYEANGDKVGAQRVFEAISNSATAIAQLLRQYGQLKSSTPQGYVLILTKHLKDKFDIDLTDAQKQIIEKLYLETIKASDIKADALNDLADNLKDPNYNKAKGYKLWGEATVKLEDADRNLNDFIDKLKPATAESFFQKLTAEVQGNLLTIKSLLVNPVANAFQAGYDFSKNELANLQDYILNIGLKTGRTKISGFNPTAIRLGAKAAGRGLSKANRMLLKGASSSDLSKIDVSSRLKPTEALKSLYKTLTGKQGFEFVRTIQDLAEGTIGIPANLLLRLLPYGDLPRNEQVKMAKLIEIGINKFGLRGADLESFTLRPDPESLAQAELEGDKSTLQEPNRVYKGINYMINSIDSAKGKVNDRFTKALLSGIKFVVRGTIVPFLKTPINYAAKTIRFTNPIIPYTQAVYHITKAVLAAKNEKNPISRASKVREQQAKITEYLAEAMVSQAIMSAAYILIGNGLVTGDPPEEKKERDLMLASGFGPNRINISGLKRLLTGGDPTYKPDDITIAYNALGILGAQLGISSNTLTQSEKESIRKSKFITTEGKPFYTEDNGFYTTSVMAMSSNLPATFTYTLNQGFAQGAGSLLTAVQEKKYSEWSNQTLKTLITGLSMPNTVYQSFKAGDEYARNVYTEDQVKEWGNIIKERYGDIEDLPIKYDILGRPIKLTPEGSNPYVYHVLDIFRTQKILQDKTIYYIFDLHKKTGDNSVVPSSVKTIMEEEGGLYPKLKPEQISELQRIVGEERDKYLKGTKIGSDGKKFTSLSIQNYDLNNNSEIYWEKMVDKLKRAYSAGTRSGKKRFEREVLSKTKK